MAGPLIVVSGLKKLQRDFAGINTGARPMIRDVIKGALQPMLVAAKSQAMARAQTGELAGAWIASVRGSSGALRNRLPQAAPLEFGGTIAPRGTPISLMPETHMVYGPGGAIEEGKDKTEALLQKGFDRLARDNGFTG